MADGKYLRLGKKNLADTVTALVKSGVGPVLSLLVASGPPLEVNSQDKVDNLNSDMLDDRHAHELTGVSQLRIGGEPPLVPPDTITYGKLSITPPARGYIRLTGNVTFTHDLSKVTDPQPGQVPGSGLVQGASESYRLSADHHRHHRILSVALKTSRAASMRTSP